MSQPAVAGSVDAAIAVLAGTPAALRALAGGLPDSALDHARDGDWGPRDVVAHLLSIEPWTLVDRTRRLIELDDPELPSIDETSVLQSSGLRERSMTWLLYEFARVRRESVRWLRSIEPVMLARSGRHEEVGAVTLAEIVHHKACHDLDHLRQLAGMLSEPLNEGRGNMRRVAAMQ